ncbi:tRNA glutamyl-Q(34) synthetase GluQRS [Acuticoccus sp. MNP-M23]|uniref:tRNA glutamyl-Q(34) synthetase GluQRS n=1 Tax=Acuticoccus sp. MNP-M23 TaxID=3072793 RepID=UPI0028161B5A|nr:tRNA glutamyl-Q(34) synthetase GluQRS [Acuticoccus sp. MNP-M23]WMS41562.1 tRNA glutamyl-Q(34) synthetase GluQRS [Acuticoccus sp. MNP-M23]
MLRFAPSPNGPLHRGHALSLLANEAMADVLGLPLTIRMEDIDQSRARPAFERAILADIAWLGVAWTPPMRRQSEHFADYRDALTRLSARGLIYPSFATRREIAQAMRPGAPRDPDGAPRFIGDDAILGEAETARRRAGQTPAAWRLHMARAVDLVGTPTFRTVTADGTPDGEMPADPLAWGDVVLARKDTPTSYHLSVVVDDAHQGISHVVRGADLLAATAVHRVLQTLLDLPAPAYRHHPLILGPDGRKLSKSAGAESLEALAADGLTPGALRATLEPILREEPA